jgi:HSP20 family protein
MVKAGGWDPLSELRGVQKRLNQLFESALARSNFDAQEDFDSWSPVCDAYESSEALVVCLELPGLEQEDIELRLDGDDLIVEGLRKMARGQAAEHYHRVERSFGRFQRRFHLPSTVDRGGVTASYRDGVLRVELPNTTGKQPASFKVTIE